MFETICEIAPDCRPDVLEHSIQLAVEIAREGREGTLGKSINIYQSLLYKNLNKTVGMILASSDNPIRHS